MINQKLNKVEINSLGMSANLITYLLLKYNLNNSK